jgi:hypothetical protein
MSILYFKEVVMKKIYSIKLTLTFLSLEIIFMILGAILRNELLLVIGTIFMVCAIVFGLFGGIKIHKEEL